MVQAQYGVSAENVHLIGHSLGSHIAGYAGERVKGLGRISGTIQHLYIYNLVNT